MSLLEIMEQKKREKEKMNQMVQSEVENGRSSLFHEMAEEDVSLRFSYMVALAMVACVDGQPSTEKVQWLQNLCVSMDLAVDQLSRILQIACDTENGDETVNSIIETLAEKDHQIILALDMYQAGWIDGKVGEKAQQMIDLFAEFLKIDSAIQKLLKAWSEANLLGEKDKAVEAVELAKKMELHICADEVLQGERTHFLGLCCYQGIGMPQDEEKAVKWLTKAAEDGCSDSQYRIGEFAFSGKCGIKENNEAAFEWYKKAGAKGHVEAQCRIGECYSNGYGVGKNDEEAAKWYLKAAEQGNSFAQYKLAHSYHGGNGLAQDFQFALEWYQKADEGGCEFASNELGWMYEHGQGVEQDYQLAIELYQKSAKRNNSWAMSKIGDFYYHGTGVEQSYQLAMEFHEKAAQSGHAYSNYIIGWMYEFGQGVDENVLVAQEYYKKSVEGGYYNESYKYDPAYRYGYNLLFFYDDIEAGTKWFQECYGGTKNLNYINSIISEVRNLEKKTCYVGLVLYSGNKSKREIENEVRENIRECLSSTSNSIKSYICSYGEFLNEAHRKLVISKMAAGTFNGFNSKEQVDFVEEFKLKLIPQCNIDNPTEVVLREIEYMDVSTDGFFGKRLYSIENWPEIDNIAKELIKEDVDCITDKSYAQFKDIADGIINELEKLKRNMTV